MNDPYKVLGISPNASEQEIKRAYRDLARKYHPDNYHDNPLSELAQEKMKQINEAYDFIMKNHASGSGYRQSSRNAGGWAGQEYSNSGQRTNYAGGSGYGGSSVRYDDIRQDINLGNIASAEQKLNSITTKTAEWYFLMGSVNYRRGWLDEARRNFQAATSMEPHNQEYQQALLRMSTGNTSPYRRGGFGADENMNQACNCCSSLMCADCCCECMGGDIIPCI